MDVVPAGDASAWEHPPFQGVVAGGYVWGRGAIDDKQAVMGHLEAVEDLLAQGRNLGKNQWNYSLSKV